MRRNTLYLAGLALLVASAGHAQTDKKKTGGNAEITFADGSLVRMALLPETIEVMTQYGKLSVPVRDIRRIDFGLHLPEGADKKIEDAIKQLGSGEFKERDAAARQLVELGAFAYPALLQAAARKSEPEVAKRAQEAIAKIKTKVPAKDLRLGEEDKIVTPIFTIVGRIVTPAFKAKSQYFGEVQLALANLRQLRTLVEAREAEVAVDATKHAQPNQWLDTGVVLDRGSTLLVAASGEVELRPSAPGSYVCGPRGYTRAGGGPAGGGFPAGGGKKKGGGGAMFDPPARAYPGTLVGRIGEGGDTFVIGDRFEGQTGEGRLYLQIISSNYDTSASGSYQVRVAVHD